MLVSRQRGAVQLYEAELGVAHERLGLRAVACVAVRGARRRRRSWVSVHMLRVWRPAGRARAAGMQYVATNARDTVEGKVPEWLTGSPRIKFDADWR